MVFTKRIVGLFILMLGLALAISSAGSASAAQLTLSALGEGSGVTDIVAAASAASAGGDKAVNDGYTFVYFNNGDSGPHTVTVTAQRTSAQIPGSGILTKANATLTVAAGKEGLIGPFPVLYYNDGQGNIAITYDAVTSCKVAAVRLIKLP